MIYKINICNRENKFSCNYFSEKYPEFDKEKKVVQFVALGLDTRNHDPKDLNFRVISSCTIIRVLVPGDEICIREIPDCNIIH